MKGDETLGERMADFGGTVRDDDDSEPSKGGRMLHKTIKAAATATDEGKFTAIAAAYTVDRMDEQIARGAFEKTIGRWQESGKQIPVHWDHEGDPESIIGHADPKSMREAEEGLYVRGRLDLEQNEKARAAWRAMKNNSIGLSFGYLVTKDAEVDGIKHLHEIDLFEISVTPAPVNPDTRIVSMKSNTGATVTTSASGTDSKVTVKDSPYVTFTVDELLEKAKDDPNMKKAVEAVEEAVKANELSEEAAADLRKGYDKLEIDLMAAGVLEAKAEDKLSDVEDEGPNEEQQIEDARTEEPSEVKVEAQDPLRKAYDDLAYELTMRGISLAEPPKVEAEPKDDLPSMEELRKHSYDLMLETLIGSEKT